MINGHEKSRSVIVQSNLLEPIEIFSDGDFETTVWTGNGSISNPYVLANKAIEGVNCIWIQDTSRYFKIENCTLTAEYTGIFLRDTSNSVIINNTIKSGGVSIDIVEVNNCTIANNSIWQFSSNIASWAPCIELYESENVAVHDNVIKGGPISVYVVYSTCHCTIIRNTMACNELTIFLASSTYNNSIIGNELGSLSDEIARDDGVNNTWDDGVSLGNAWIDYQEVGEYLVPGSANSVDHFPTVFNPSFPMDFNGPRIYATLVSQTIDYEYTLPPIWFFYATVNDSSGVDTVLISVNGIFHEMHHAYGPNPDAYVYNHPTESSMRYSFWANDTLGLISETDYGQIHLGILHFGDATSSSYIQNLVTTIILLVGCIGIIAIFWKIKSKE